MALRTLFTQFATLGRGFAPFQAPGNFYAAQVFPGLF